MSVGGWRRASPGCRRASTRGSARAGRRWGVPSGEVPLQRARPRSVSAVVIATTALLGIATDLQDDTAWQRSLTAAAQAWLRGNPFDTPVGALSETSSDPSLGAPRDAAASAPVTMPLATPAAPSSEATQPTAGYRAAAEAFLDTLPGGQTATIEWGDPQGHLGGVWIPGSETIILNATRLDGQLGRTQDVLRHEIGHVHQNRAMAAAGMSLPDFEARLDAIFDGQGIERSADAVALLLGASSVRYASTFTDAQYDAARTILDDRVP